MSIDTLSAYRTLCQCTFGPNQTDIGELQSSGSIEAWIERQTNKPISSWYRRFERDQNRSDYRDGVLYATSWTGLTLDSDYEKQEYVDHLRQRVAYILTQLFVVSTRDPALSPVARRSAFCLYFDGLSERAFGNFRELLKFVSTSPVMGEYLTFIDNMSNQAHQADENYAREILQLFTLGPVKLEGSGKPVLDAEGRPVPTYTQEDIEQLAKVFTGWKFAEGTSGHERYMEPLEPIGEHNQDEKRILGKTFPAGQSASDDLDSFVEHLMNQNNLYTYIAYFFISKMVTSNPKPGHVRRVRNAFVNSGGDMQTLITAILTDQVALHSSDTDGKVRDPLIVFTHSLRALGATLSRGESVWAQNFNWYDRMLPMSAPSVFYYYQHDDAPSDPALEGHFAPEFNIYEWNNIYQYGREIKELVVQFNHHQKGWEIDNKWDDLYWKNTPETDLELINAFDDDLFAGQMAATTRSACLTFLEECPRHNESYYADIRALVMNLVISPEFIVQR
ncbi:DUF1800 family protein [uncultured Vibrio sp.]|uniref:DUF1800 family protein n=1 Tax=uncultured Vibrio sp. TaxID=114054 RepID=UPI0025DECCD2|nr:DUF1800 family protein [uncultured Vibrio sp.]